jgi:hypothetical protein
MEMGLNSVGQQFLQYQQNDHHLSPQIIEHKTITTHGIGNPGLDFGQVNICGRVTPLDN